MKSYKKSWPARNLSELVSFLNERHPEGLSLRNLSQRTGISEASISNFFCKDDMMLSKAEEIAGKYGYVIALFFPVAEPDEDMPKLEMKRKFHNPGKLIGLLQYIQVKSISIPLLAELSRHAPHMLYRAFDTGDIRLSVLGQITNALGINCIWKFIKSQN